jgi:hypothetical protein
MNGQRTYQQVGGKWTLISNGTTQVYTQTATGWQGPGAPAQLIASGALYYDTVEKRNYQQMGGIWVLL